MDALAEKLNGLLSLMTGPQKHRFKRAVVRQAIYFIEAMLPPEDEDDGDRIGVCAAQRWLAEPTEENARKAIGIAASESIDGGARYFDYPAYFLEPAFAAGAEDVSKAAQAAVLAGVSAERQRLSMKNQEREGVGWKAERAALEWQIAAAQATLDQEDLPPLI